MRLSELLAKTKAEKVKSFQVVRVMGPDYPTSLVKRLMDALNQLMGPGRMRDPIQALEYISPGINAEFDDFINYHYPHQADEIDAIIQEQMPGTTRLEAILGSGYAGAHNLLPYIVDHFLDENYEAIMGNIERLRMPGYRGR